MLSSYLRMSYNCHFINFHCAVAMYFAAHELPQTVYRLVLRLRKVILANNFERNGYE
jgi:hypothetical protein